MAVAFDAITTHGGTVIPYNINHVPVGTPSGVLFLICIPNAPIPSGLAVTYGGVTMTQTALSPVVKLTGEGMSCLAFFLGSGIPSGAQTLAVTGTGIGETHSSAVITLTASGNTEVVDTSTISQDSGANPSTTISLGGRTSYCALIFGSGLANVASVTPLANWTSRIETVGGSRLGGVYTYNIIGTADVTAGWTQVSDDGIMIGVAVSEVVSSTRIKDMLGQGIVPWRR